MKGIISCIFVCIPILCVITNCSAAKWSEWRSVTLCSAKPCQCKDRLMNDEDTGKPEPCYKGEQVQMRICERQPGEITPCPYDQHGPFRINKNCTSESLCPRWLEWEKEPCICPVYLLNGERLEKRRCHDPTGLYQCTQLNKQTGMDESKLENCKCTEIKTTAAPVVTTTVKLPKTTTEVVCCGDYSDSFDDDTDDGDKFFQDYCVACDENGKPTTPNPDSENNYDDY